MIRTRRRVAFAVVVALFASVLPRTVEAQQPIFPGSPPPGVYVQPDGTVKRRELDEKNELGEMRLRARLAIDAAKHEKTGYVSLPKAFATAREAIASGKSIPDDVRFLGGLTQIKFIFLYAESNDLVIAGPAEPYKTAAGDDGYAVGTKTGRPVMRLEDLVVAMRVVRDVRGGAFGCRLDPDPGSPARISDVMAQMARATRPARVKAVQQAMGPQKVSFFGSVPADTRFAMTTIAADYELKRYGLGLARHVVPGLGNIVDNTRQAANMIWFELAYEPILVSPDENAYGLRGPRLKVGAGGFDWDPKGATPKAFEFAKKMSASLEMLAAQQPLVADLQNLADLSVVAALIQKDRLDRKIDWDTAWLMTTTGDSLASFPVAKVTVPKTADAQANYTNGAIAAGGVMLTPSKVVQAPTQPDADKQLDKIRAQGAELRKANPSAPVVTQQ